MPIIAQTPQFTIRSYQPEDEVAYLEMFSDPRVNVHLPPRTVEENRALFQESMQMANKPFNRWSIISPTGEYLGMCMLRYIDGHPEGELVIGYSLAEKHWGKGIATGVTQALVAYGFSFPSTPKIVAITTTGNAASKVVLQKTGFVECGSEDHDGITIINFERPRIE